MIFLYTNITESPIKVQTTESPIKVQTTESPIKVQTNYQDLAMCKWFKAVFV